MTVRSMAAGLLLAMGLVTVAAARPSAAEDMKEVIAPLLKARDAHRAGQVAGHAHGDPPRPSAPAAPYEGVSVLLVPYSEGLESELDAVKQHLRDSLRNYMAAATDITAARRAYERALLWVGGGELIRGDVSNAAGLVALAEVPVGDWLLLAWREEVHPARPAGLRPQDIAGFRDLPVRTGYSLVSYWRMRVRIRAGETTSVDLNDRNVWITAVREDLYPAQGTPKRAEPKKRR